MLRRSWVRRRSWVCLLTPLLLLLAAPATQGAEIDRYTHLLQGTADHFEFGMRVERSADKEGGFSLSVWKRMGDGGVSIQCLAFASARHKQALLKIAEIMGKASKEIQTGGMPTVKKTWHTIEGFRVLEADTPTWTYKTPVTNTTMPRMRAMSVDISATVTLTVTTNGGAGSPKRVMRKLLQDLKAGPTEQPPEEGDGLDLRIAASAEGYAGAVERLSQGEYTPGRTTIRGVVRDTDGMPIQGATVVTMERGASATTGKDGRYELVVHGSGEKPWTPTLNLVMAKKLTGFGCRLETSRPLVANGKLQRVTLHLTAEGKPLKGRTIKVSLPPEWRHRTRKVTWIGHGKIRSLPDTLTTNQQGAVTFDFPAAGLGLDRPKVLRDRAHLRYFPVQGELVVTDLLTKLTCRTDYRLVSPYPRIKTMRMIDVTAGNWQPKPGSLLEIDDADSTSFTVEIKVAGRLRIPRVKEIYTRTMYLPQYEGGRLQFFYQPPKWGMDLEKQQPGDLWKEFGMFNLQLAGKIMVDNASGAFLKQVSASGATASIPGKLNGNIHLSNEAIKQLAAGQADKAEAVLNIAKKPWSVVETVDKIDQQIGSTDSPGTRLIEAHDTLAGIVELRKKLAEFDVVPESVTKLAEKFGGKLIDPKKLATMSDALSKSAIPLHVLKAVYENAKFMLKLHRQFEAVCNAQKDTLLVPVLVTVTDADGYRTTAARAVTVWLWKQEGK